MDAHDPRCKCLEGDPLLTEPQVPSTSPGEQTKETRPRDPIDSVGGRSLATSVRSSWWRPTVAS
jgi:hypothetical protein